MHEEQYQARIIPLQGRFDSELYIFRKAGYNYVNLQTDEDGALIEQEVKAGADPSKPFLRAPERVLRAILSALDGVRKPLGVPEPVREYTTGKLEATERHLEDMRKLVFEEKTVISGTPSSNLL